MNYFWLAVRHKWFVFQSGLRTKANLWDLIIHDWTKFLPSELPNYQKQFFGKKDDALGFITCWSKHQNRHPHHWEYWIPRTGHNRCIPPYPDNVPIPMPERVVREMVADWLGAGRAYEGKYPDINDWTWYNKSFPNIKKRLHPQTIELVLKVIEELK